jgi:hypothetical protein
MLDQLSRYLNHLHQLRRINEGDDTADAPGYSMNLMRFPVSVLPGTKTREGYGAEVTLSVTPCISDKLLESTFKSLVINDLLDTLTPPILQLVNSASFDKTLEEILTKKQEIAKLEQDQQDEQRQFYVDITSEVPEEQLYALNLSGDLPAELRPLFQDRFDALEAPGAVRPAAPAADVVEGLKLTVKKYSDRKATGQMKYDTSRNSKQEEIDNLKADLAALLTIPVVSATPRLARYPISSTQIVSVFGAEELLTIRKFARTHVPGDETRLFHDIRGFLGEELDKAWKMLASKERSGYRVWDLACKGLADVVRNNNASSINTKREHLIPQLGIEGSSKLFQALAWAILVESAILDQQLHEDMQQVAEETGGLRLPNQPSFENLHFWGSSDNYPKDWEHCGFPTPMALFRDYVACKWPIHVFAIDPVTQDQNVADSFSSRREIQLTLSVALASGQINAQEYLQYARRLETEIDTIALNRTVVGFSHGTDTFGWRFQPRIQTPPTPSNARVIFNDLLIGGPSRDSNMRTSMLEPGTRECVAVVLMPSILTQVMVDCRSSWYRLDKPHSRKFDLEDSVSLGQEVVELQDLCRKCCKDEEKYRPNDVWRLERAVNQLEKQLPLQNSIVHVPNENTLGGTQLFEGGQTSLGPELIGFYGEPGVHRAKTGETDETTLFLVGRNFSVTGTRVIAAGEALGTDKIDIISRNVLQVTIPAVREDKIETVDDEEVIDLHVATPYGVSHHLQIPVALDVAAKKKAEADAAAKAAETEEAQKAITNAVTQHVEAAHTGDPLIVWKNGQKTATRSKITFATDGKVKSFAFDNSGKTELKLQTPESYESKTAFDPDSKVSLGSIEVAFWVTAYKDDAGTKENEIGKQAAGIIEGSKLTSYDAIAPTIEKALKGMVELKNSSEIKSLKVSAYVRRTGAKAAYKVPDELKVNVKTGTEQLAIAVPADAAAAN